MHLIFSRSGLKSPCLVTALHFLGWRKLVPLCLQSALRAVDSSTDLDDEGRICGPLTYYLIS